MNKSVALAVTAALFLAGHAVLGAAIYVAPQGNVMARNICWGGKWGSTERKAQPYVKFQDNLVDVDPRFAGKPPADFRLAEDSPARAIGFQPIPFDRIGVYSSDDRASWPVVHAVRPAPSSAGLPR